MVRPVVIPCVFVCGLCLGESVSISSRSVCGCLLRSHQAAPSVSTGRCSSCALGAPLSSRSLRPTFPLSRSSLLHWGPPSPMLSPCCCCGMQQQIVDGWYLPLLLVQDCLCRLSPPHRQANTTAFVIALAGGATARCLYRLFRGPSLAARRLSVTLGFAVGAVAAAAAEANESAQQKGGGKGPEEGGEKEGTEDRCYFPSSHSSRPSTGP